MLPNTSKHPLLPTYSLLLTGQVPSCPVGLWGRHWLQPPGPGAIPGTADKGSHLGLLSQEHSFQSGYSLPRPIPSLGAGGVGWVPWLPNPMLRIFKQVELTLFSQVPNHLAGHLLSKKPFLIRTQRQIWGAQEVGRVTPDFSLRLLGQEGVGVGMLGKQP